MTLGPRLAGAARAALVTSGGHARTKGAVVLAYHGVRQDAVAGPGLSVRPATLRRHLTQALGAGLTVVPLPDLTARLLAGDPVDGLMSIVFDDALHGVFEHAAPILADLNLPATVFVVSGVLGQAPPWWSGSQRTLDRRQIIELHQAGWTIGAHTRHHPSLPSLQAAPLDNELAGCRSDLEDMCGEPIRLLAYPYGHHDTTVRSAVRAAGFEAAFTFMNGRLTPGLDRFRLPRLTMAEHHTRFRLAYHLSRSAASWPDHQLASMTGDL